MPVTLTDVTLVVIIAGFVFSGFWFGMIHMVGSFASILLAAIISGQYFEFVSQKLSFLFGGHDNLGRVVTFVLLFLVVTRLVGFVFWLINKVFHLIAVIPGMKLFNRIGGAVLGGVEGLVLMSLAVFLLARYPLSDSLTNALANSAVVGQLLNLANKIAPLLPDFVQKAQQVIGM